jgi:hypothetical protein
MPEWLTVALGEVPLHRQELAALETMRLFVAPVGLIVFGELDPFERTNCADPRASKAVLADQLAKCVL